MARIRHLNRAPIAEAVIEFRVRSATPVSLETLSALSANCAPEYPIEDRVQSVAATLGIQDGKPMTDAQYSQLGFRRKTRDQHDVVQFRSDLFAFSQLHPYT